VIRWTRVRGALVGTALVLAAGIPIIAHATKERRAELDKLAKIQALANQLQPIAQHAKEGRRIYINGEPIYFRLQTTLDGVHKAIDGVNVDCASGDPERMLGVPSPFERSERPRSLGLTKTIRQDGDGVAATLCVFHDGDARDENTAQIRYTFAHQNDDNRTSLFTIATEQHTDAMSMFPVEGDAPGGDFDSVPRPRDAKRLFAAIIEGENYAVRIYEQHTPLKTSVAQYDKDMAAAGWVASADVVREIPDARMYSRGEDRFVASFLEEDGVTKVTVAPFPK
jgi:hypothetical protein